MLDNSDKSLAIIDGKSNELTSKIKFGDLSPTDIVINTNTNIVYCSFSPVERIISIDGTSNKLIHTFISSNSTTFTTAELAIDPYYNVLYSLTLGRLAILNDKGLIDTVITGLDDSNMNAMGQPIAVNPNTHKIYATDVVGRNIYVINFGTKNGR